eukprot:m.1661618 g.1661618  ORF g.1661618 m.1661618 type:complete len:50 (-) comp126074_c0_seq1:100-249(-)
MITNTALCMHCDACDELHFCIVSIWMQSLQSLHWNLTGAMWLTTSSVFH